MLDRGGEGFIENRVIGDIHNLMRQFVKNQARQIHFRVADERIQYRIAEPA